MAIIANKIVVLSEQEQPIESVVPVPIVKVEVIEPRESVKLSRKRNDITIFSHPDFKYHPSEYISRIFGIHK